MSAVPGSCVPKASFAEPQGVTEKSVGRVHSLLQKLKGADADAREIAADELDAIAREGLTLEEGIFLLEAAVERFPSRRFPIQDTASELVRAAAQHPRPEHVPVVERLYRRYHPKARFAALELIARLETREASVALMGLVRSHARANRLRALPSQILIEHAHDVDVFFPELFEFVELPDLTWSICELCLGWMNCGVLGGAEVAAAGSRLLGVYAPRRDRLRDLESRGKGESEEYGRLRREAGLIIDLLGNIPTPAVQAELRRALSFRDVRLRYFAVVSLLRLGRLVSPDDVACVAAGAEMRTWLWEELERQGATNLFPAAFKTKEAFAESELVQWLAFPAELGHVPDEIELMSVVGIEPLPGTLLDYYVFRYRLGEPHWAAKDGWLAGFAGPYLRSAPPGTRSLGEAGSRFEAWSRRTPEGHVGDLERLVVDWRDRLTSGS